MDQKLIAFVACSGSAAGKDRFKACKTCKDAVASGFKRGECKDGCVGVGSCIQACTKGALSLKDGKIVVDKKLCDGCGDCAKADVCPQNLIKMVPADATNFIPCSNTDEDDEKVRAMCGFGCIACGECERACPKGAVSVINNHAVIDYEKCEGCVACAVKCKKKIIVDTEHDITALKSNVAFVACNGDGRIAKCLKENGIDSAEKMKEFDFKSHDLCEQGCLGCGACERACRYKAVKVVKGVAVVNPDKCVACKDCTYVCPRHLISILPYQGQKAVPCASNLPKEEKSKVCSSGCIACGDCVANCPNGAVFAEGAHAVIDPEICENCNACLYVCPQNLQREISVPEWIYLQRQALLNEEKGE